MTSPVRSVNVDHVSRLMEAIRIGGELDMEKFLRVASDIGGYTPETDSRYQLDGRAGAPDETERFEWVSRWLGLKDPQWSLENRPMGRSGMEMFYRFRTGLGRASYA